MSGLYDDIVSTNAPTKAGGLYDDIVPTPKRPGNPAVRAQLQAQKDQAAAEGPGTMLNILASDPVQGIAEGLTLRPVLHGIGTAASAGLNKVLALSAKLQGLEPSTVSYEAGRPIIPIPAAHGTNLPPVVVAGLRMVEGLTTPEGALTLPLAAGSGTTARAAATLFAPQMVTGAVERSADVFNPELDSYERQVAGWESLMTGALGAKVGTQIRAPVSVKPSGLRAGDDTFSSAQGRTALDDIRAVGPEQRLLPPPGGTVDLPPGVPSARPSGAARFVQTEGGRIVDLGDVDPSVARNIYTEQARSTGEPLRVGQTLEDLQGKQILPPLIKEQPPIEMGSEMLPRPVEQVAGGQVSFAGEAPGIPNARQQAQPPTGGGIGTGIRAAIEKNQEAGSIPNPFPAVGRAINRAVEPLREAQRRLAEKGPFLPGGFQKFADQATERARALSAEGLGKIPGLRQLVGDKRAAQDPATQGMVTHTSMVQKGEEMTALWLESRKGAKRMFPQDAQRQVTLANGRKGDMSDVIEAEIRNPGSQPLTQGQKNFVQWWKGVWGQQVKELQAEGVRNFVDEHGNPIPVRADYFPRPAVGREGVKGVGGKLRGLVGSKQGFQFERQFPTEAEGRRKGIIYEKDEYTRVARLLRQTYRAIADQRLANEPTLQGTGQGPSFLRREGVSHPAFAGRTFDAETAAKLEAYMKRNPSFIDKLGRVSDELKSSTFSLDASAPLNQGLVMLFSHPGKWVKSTARHFQAFLDPSTLRKYLAQSDNLRAAQQLVSRGSNVANLYDQLRGAGEGTYAGRVAPIRASARAMQTFLAVAKIELYKALEPVAKREGWFTERLAETVDNMVGSGRMETAGVSPGRAAFERTFMFNAPSYIRSGLNLMAMAAQEGVRGKQGRVAQKALGSFAASILLTTYAVYQYQVSTGQMSKEEMIKRLTPTSGKWLGIPIDLPNGKRMEVSPGGIVKAIAHTIARAISDPASLTKAGPENPIVRFAGNRLPPLAGAIKKVATGEDYRGEPIEGGLPRIAAEAIVPLGGQALAEPGTGQEKFVNFLTSELGLNAYPEGITDRRGRLLNQEAVRQGGKLYTDLSTQKRLEASRKVESDMFSDRKPMTPGQELRALQSSKEHAKELSKFLSPQIKEVLRANNLEVPGFEVTRQRMGATLRLSGAEQEKLLEFQLRIANKELPPIFASPQWRDASPERRKAILGKAMGLVHEAAWGEMVRQIEATSTVR